MLIYSTAFRILSTSYVAGDSIDLDQDGPVLRYGWITPKNMALYGGGTLGLLEDGWGIEYYSQGPNPDFFDERLFNSLVQVVGGTSMVMRGFDLNKRASEVLNYHMSNPVAQKIAEGWRHPF